MFKKLTNVCVTLIQRFLPDPFLFCIILTVIVFVLAIPLTGQGPLAVIVHWGNGVWSLLAFSMQMALVLVLGSAMASSAPMQSALRKLAAIPQTPTQCIILVTVVSLLACWLNWGFGLVVGAIFAKEIAKQGKRVDYRLLIASAYSGFLIWHGGFSGSIPLTVATLTDTVAKQTAGALTAAVPTSATIFAPFNLAICLAFFIILPLVNAKMHPEADKMVLISPELLKEESVSNKAPVTPAEKVENSRILSWIIILIAGIFIVRHFITKGFLLDLNIVNLIFLTLGIIFHGNPINYVRAINKAAREAGGILLQFPFYAGIMGMMVGVSASTGLTLAGVISAAFIAMANQHTFPIFSFISAGVVNFFVPSGGGQWAVQAPIMMPAGAALGVAPAVTAMSIAWGDAWTNMIQPFWALPALGIAGLGARDIMGYCVMDLIISGIIICAVFLGIGYIF
ncbi:MAG: short-chain fatty acid transporter [Elusimicrobiota bacterium]|jgi:short-chain fatty acids transporter|nr:short-chain fatty acid transporter [Elusimicrobiota bacterium]